MLHGLRVDLRRAGPYLALLTLGCTGLSFRPLLPATPEPVAAAEMTRWVDSLTPTGNSLVRFKWKYQGSRSDAGGRGSARVAGPDSMRFDIRGPLGAGATAAVVIADSAQWVEGGEDTIEKLVPSYELLWALLGVPLRPPAGAELGGVRTAKGQAWRFVSGPDTVEYLLERRDGRARFLAEVREAGRVIGRAETELNDGAPVKARLLVPDPAGKLDLTFDARSRPASFPPDIWLRR